MEIRASAAVQHFSEIGDIMDDFANPAVQLDGSQKSPVLVIIEHHVLARTCILSILKRELTGVEIVEMATTSGLTWVIGKRCPLDRAEYRDKQINDPSVEDNLALLAESCPNAYVAVLSNRDDEATASAAMQRGVRGFFPTSNSSRGRHRRIAPCSCRWGLPTAAECRQNEASSLKTLSADTGAPELTVVHEGNGASKIEPKKRW